ncbi:hypothetical protein Y695_02571 [Hydrogenophaga sp. T4]|nr:hypothetical protein Y695_02571 [Hydrogenophaga sp. T4]
MRSKLFKILGAIVGVVVIGTSLNLWSDDRALEKRGVRAEVVGVSDPSESTSGRRVRVKTQRADIEVEQENGESRIFRRMEIPQSVVKKINAGEAVYVIFDPLKPDENHKFEGMASDHWWFMALGVFFLFAAVFLL